MTLVDFDTEVRVTRYSQADFPRLVERVRGRKPDGYTALYDALGVYLDGAGGRRRAEGPRHLHRRGRHAQRDDASATCSTWSRRRTSTIYAIGFLREPVELRPHGPAAAAPADRGGHRRAGVLPAVAEGPRRRVRQGRRGDRSALHARLPVVGRRPTARGATSRSGSTRPDLKGAKIRTRKGYFAPDAGRAAAREPVRPRPVLPAVTARGQAAGPVVPFDGPPRGRPPLRPASSSSGCASGRPGAPRPRRCHRPTTASTSCPTSS